MLCQTACLIATKICWRRLGHVWSLFFVFMFNLGVSRNPVQHVCLGVTNAQSECCGDL